MRSLTLAQAWSGFLMDKRASGKSPYTLRNYANTMHKLQLYLSAVLHTDGSRLMLRDLDHAFWVRFFAWIQEGEFAPGGIVGGRTARHLSAKTIRNYHTDFSAFYTWAVKLGCATVHLIANVERPDYERPLIDLLTEADIKAMLIACDYTREWHNSHTASKRQTAMRDRAIIMLLVSTGIRASELCGATRADLDLDDNQLKVSGKSRGRAPKQRIVHFGKRTRRAMWRYLVEYAELPPEAPLFPADVVVDPRPMSRRGLDTLLKRIGERAGVKGVYPHRFRHTFAVNYLLNGGDSLALKRALGHASLKMVDHYVQLASSDLAAIQRTADPADNWNL